MGLVGITFTGSAGEASGYGRPKCGLKKVKAPGERRSAPQAIGSPKYPVILVEFTDKAFTVDNPAEYYRDLLGKRGYIEDGAFGSVLDWLEANSLGRFTPEFEIIGPIKLSKPSIYYGANNSHGNDIRPREMVVDAIRAAAQQSDFSRFDNDYDGMVDFIYIYYAGEGENSFGGPSSIWPASGSLIEEEEWVQGNGIIADTYAFSNEWMKDCPDGIGTFIYQFCRHLGLPSLEEPGEGRLTSTPGSWDVMDTGYLNNSAITPPYLSAIERMELGWLEPRRLDSPTEVSLGDLGATNEAVLIPAGDSEYFLLEYRAMENWDLYLPNHGLLIWHVDYDPEAWERNEVNHFGDHHRVRLMKPNLIEVVSKDDSAYLTNISGWCYPGTSDATELSDSSLPAMRRWSGEAVQFPISDIVEDMSVPRVNLVAGDPMLAKIPVGIVPSGDEIGEDTFVASWQPVEGADGYLLTVYPGVEKLSGKVSCDFGTGNKISIPYGWESSSSLSYTSPLYYGENSPSLRFKDEGGNLVSGWTTAEITELSFWFKGVKAEVSTLMVSGKDSDHRWHLIDELSLSDSEGQTVTYDREHLPADIHQIRWQFHRFAGSMALDDISIHYGEEILPCEGYDKLPVGTGLSYPVDNLPEDENFYRFTVRALHGGAVSEESAPVSVLLGRAEVADIVFGPKFSVNGNMIVSTVPVSVYTTTGIMAGCGTEVALSGSGMYIVRGEGISERVLIP